MAQLLSLTRYLLPALLILAAACGSSKGTRGAGASEAAISMTVSEELANDFVPITTQRYRPEQLPPLFENMSGASNEYCSMLWGKKKYKKSKAAKLITLERLPVYWRNCNKCIRSMTAGCWNFFKMNDQRPDRDFEFVKLYYKEKAFDCYSVGFLQPYIMHNKMGCNSITMLDIDWRILHAHWQFVQLFKQKKFTSEEALENNIGQLGLAWVAHSAALKPRAAASMKILCKRRQRKNCVKEILEFQRKTDQVSTFRLNLAGLHDGDYRNPGSKRTKVVYLSNAIERIYTTKKQFSNLIRNLTVSLEPGERAVLIHHVGGYPQFGIYQFARTEGSYELTTVCRDLYTNTAIGSTEKYYESYFEKISSSKKRKIPRCRKMLTKLQKEAATAATAAATKT